MYIYICIKYYYVNIYIFGYSKKNHINYFHSVPFDPSKPHKSNSKSFISQVSSFLLSPTCMLFIYLIFSFFFLFFFFFFFAPRLFPLANYFQAIDGLSFATNDGLSFSSLVSPFPPPDSAKQ